MRHSVQLSRQKSAYQILKQFVHFVKGLTQRCRHVPTIRNQLLNDQLGVLQLDELRDFLA